VTDPSRKQGHLQLPCRRLLSGEAVEKIRVSTRDKKGRAVPNKSSVHLLHHLSLRGVITNRHFIIGLHCLVRRMVLNRGFIEVHPINSVELAHNFISLFSLQLALVDRGARPGNQAAGTTGH